MKTFKNLYPKIHTFENLEIAFRKARKGKRSRPNVAAFETELAQNLLELQDDLANQTYQPGDYRHFMIYDGKPRRISAASFRDRVVHHALCNVIEPIWEARFIRDSYACRKGKGTHAALGRCTHFARRYPYVLQADIVQFFPSVDLAILAQLLAKHVACAATQRLAWQIIESGIGIHAHRYHMEWFPGDNLLAVNRPRGLPIGNQTSQFWANVYLHELDRFVKEVLQCKAYLRYCDDFMLFADNKATLHQWRTEIEDFLVSLRLKIHPNKTQVYPVHTGIPFLGFTVYPDYRRLQRVNGIRFQRKLKRYRENVRGGQATFDDLQRSINGWVGHAIHGDTWGLRRRLLSKPI